MRVGAQTRWLHVLSNEQLTYYAVAAQRGQVALRQIGLVPEFKGRLLHDALGL
jgi:transposase